MRRMRSNIILVSLCILCGGALAQWNPAPAKWTDDMKIIRSYLLGEFSNTWQIENERAAGILVHPIGRARIEDITAKMVHVPRHYPAGYFILESFNYTVINENDKVDSSAQRILFFSAINASIVGMSSFDSPSRIPSPVPSNMSINFKLLRPSTSTPLPLTKSTQFQSYIVNFETGNPSGTFFSLKLSIAAAEVQEQVQLIQNGQKIVYYDTPIQWRKFPPMAGTPRFLPSYSFIFQSLQEGKKVRVIFRYNECILDGQPGPSAIGGSNIDTFEWFDSQFFGVPRISFSGNVLANIGRTYGWVYDQVKTRVDANGAVFITATYIKPTNFTVVMSEEFHCNVSTAFTSQGAYFYQL